MTNLNINQFVNFFTEKIEKELNEKNYIEASFDFSFTKEELPFDFDEENFIKLFKEKFNVLSICLDDLDGIYRCFGRLIFDVKPSMGNMHQSDIDFMNQTLKYEH